MKRQFKQFNNSDNINKMNNISAQVIEQVIEHSKDDIGGVKPVN